MYNIKIENIYFRYFKNKIYLSEEFKCPFTSFRIEKHLLHLNECYYSISQISSGYKLCFIGNNLLGFQRKKNNLELWRIIKTKSDKFFIQNKNGCYIVVNNLKIICTLKAEFKATEFNIIKLYYETEKIISDDLKILNNEHIDVLIKYIDLYDPNLNRTGIHQIEKDYDNEELRYSLRSILKNIPWIRKIFILMPNEKVR